MRVPIGAVVLLAVMTAIGASACKKTEIPTAPSAPTVSAVLISGPTTLSAESPTGQLTMTATYSDGSTRDVTTEVTTWSSASTGIVSVEATTGALSAVGAGTAFLAASYSGVVATYVVTVTGGGCDSVFPDTLCTPPSALYYGLITDRQFGSGTLRLKLNWVGANYVGSWNATLAGFSSAGSFAGNLDKLSNTRPLSLNLTLGVGYCGWTVSISKAALDETRLTGAYLGGDSACATTNGLPTTGQFFLSKQ